MTIKVKVALKYFWGGSMFYSGNLEHCVALPIEPVPKEMIADMKEPVVPHWRFSPVAAPVKQTINMKPSRVTSEGNTLQWHLCTLVKTEHGYMFTDDIGQRNDLLNKFVEVAKEIAAQDTEGD